ncbi:putative metalloprotease CJM1_0395 family protein [Roseibium marinum]|uniref:SprA family protein n=1 Tax=Roseibium marinum TaxID=281252 RepID=A0A2S3UTC4_9HYPH|nr:putative metalloprotease CJM1_0395 family protein [Roseibium marinum]POF30977.1 SprA family protein [Roseibium marinum]
MIGALLSNIPAAQLRNSGVAGVAEPGSGEDSSGSDTERARDSLAAPRAVALRASNSPVLTFEAVLALQDADGAEANDKRRQDASSEERDASGDLQAGEDETPPSDIDADAVSGDGNVASGALEASQDGEKDEDGDGLDEAEEKQVDDLAKRDQEVRAHEQAHARAGGAHAGAPSYTFQQGPDGKRYAVGGEVQIDTSTERTPDATIRKMQTVIRAATAPADPSSQDLKVAQQARAQLAEAQAERRLKQAEETGEGDESVDGPSADEQPGSVAGKSGPSDSETSKHASQQTSDRTSGESGGSHEGRAGARAGGNDAIAAYQSALDRGKDSVSQTAAFVA